MRSKKVPFLKMTASLRDQVALVTGSSSGIGRATAIELARRGAKVIVHSGSDRSRAEAVVRGITELGGTALATVADLGSPQGREDLFHMAWEWQGWVDICVLCAGANILTGPARELSFREKLRRLWEVDVLGTVELSLRLGEAMRQQGRGVILTIGWDGALRGMEGSTAQAFAVAKGAVMAFTLALAQELAPSVRVNCVAPGWIRTQWGETAGPQWQARVQAQTLLGRWGSPEEVAQVCAFLVSPESAYITGQIIFVNGGTDFRFKAFPNI